VDDGYFALPVKTELGVELNEAIFAEHPYHEGHFDLFKDEWHRCDGS